MSNGLLYIAGLIALALAALFAVPYFVDWNGYRGVFEEEATRILGREVRVGGNVNLRFLPTPFVRFDKLRIAGDSGQPFFSAESFTMRLSVPPLLKGILEANEVALKRPVLRLAVDADGGGNWRALRITPGTLPFVPADVALQSVKIEDGLVSLRGPRGSDVGQIDGLNGELRAESIEGPYAFRGTANWDGVPRELRLGTDVPDANGAVRFKTIVRGTKLANTYTLDGRILDIAGRPRIEGELTAKVELEGAPQPDPQSEAQPQPVPQPEAQPQLAPQPEPQPQPATGSKQPSQVPEAPHLDFKATVAGDAKGVRLDDMTLSFERLGQPQLITGSASASWSEALRIDLTLASVWLDLDRIAGPSGAASPIETARGFVAAAMQALPKEADTRVRFKLDQANLGNQPVSGIRLDVERSSGALLLRDLRAGLPGGVKLVLDGTVAGVSDARNFQGELALRGSSLGRFLSWATKDASVAEAVRSDGPFSLQGRFGLSDQGFDLADASAEIGGSPFTGEVHYGSGERTRLAIVLEGQEIDGAQLWPAGLGYLKGMLAGDQNEDAGASEAKAPSQRWLNLASSDVSLRLRAGRLKTGRRPLSDVDIDLAVTQGRLTFKSCKFATGDGLALDLDGDIADPRGESRGALHWVVAVPNKDAFTTLINVLELPEDISQPAARYATLAPMRLAGALTLGARGEGTADISADGTLQGGRIVATARLDGGIDGWRSSGADLALTIDSADVVATLESLAARPSRPAAEPGQRGGEVFFRAKGTPANGLLATATVKATGLYFAYDGRIELPSGGTNKIDGDIRVSARELGDVLAIAGIGSGGALRGVPIIGTLKVASADRALELKPQQLAVGGSRVEGSLALAHPDEGPAIVTAQLSVDQASIPALLGVVLDHKVLTEAQGAEPATEGQSIWPEQSFDFAALDGLEGKLGIGVGSLSLAPGMAMANARLEVALAPGKLSVSSIMGRVLGGELFAALALERAPGGANLAGDFRLTGAHLTSAVAGTKEKDVDATAFVHLEFSGAGATPGGLIAAATGKGELALGEMALRVPTPLAVVATSEAVLSGKAGGSGEQLDAALRQQILSSPVEVGPRTIAIDIADGAAKLAAFTLPSPAGETKVETTIDLASLVVDSSWQLVPRAPDVPQPDRPGKGALPPVSVVYVGPLKDAWSLEPRITADQLERELAIRRMELDADQLERLHKADAERARQEYERRSAAEADEQARTAPPPEPQPLPDQQPQPNAPPEPLAPWQVQPDAVGREPLPDINGATVVPQVPGLEPQPPGLPPPGDPAATAAATTEVPPPADGTATTETYRPRRARQHIPAGEQVLRSLQNSTN